MIKGIVALFTSGVIFSPMVLLGIFLAVYCMMRMDAEQMRALFMDYRLYVWVAFISFVHVFLFKKIYKDDGVSHDYVAMIISVLGGIIKFVLACSLMISFIVLLSF